MSTKKVSSLNNSHHARLLLGSAGEGVVLSFDWPVIGIPEARALRERASLASSGEELHLRVGAITEEAQNALLKTLEEPALGISFIFHTSRSIQLLPTFLSRLEVVTVEQTRADSVPSFDLAQFVPSNSEARLKFVSDLLKKAGEGHKAAAINFLDQLEQYLAENLDPLTASPDLIFALQEIRRGRVYLNDKSGTPKLILEHIALVLPK